MHAFFTGLYQTVSLKKTREGVSLTALSHLDLVVRENAQVTGINTNHFSL